MIKSATYHISGCTLKGSLGYLSGETHEEYTVLENVVTSRALLESFRTTVEPFLRV